jgi:hypothetical protein
LGDQVRRQVVIEKHMGDLRKQARQALPAP